MKPLLPRPRRLPQQPGKKTVVFSPIVRFAAAPPQRDDFETEDLKSLWYNRSEMMGMKMHNRITISLMGKGKIKPDDLDYCFRGLESRVRAGATQRKRNKFRAALTVILEQDRQWGENDYNVELLADRYFNFSYDSVCDAYERALKDEKEARVYYANPCPAEAVSNSTSSEDSQSGNHTQQQQQSSSENKKKNAAAA